METRGVDIFRKCVENADRVRASREAGVYSYYRSISSAQDPVVIHQGSELVMLGSNNYLGLTSHPEVKEAAGFFDRFMVDRPESLELIVEERKSTLLSRSPAQISCFVASCSDLCVAILGGDLSTRPPPGVQAS